jgi:ASC-1-like (ASCH) protein
MITINEINQTIINGNLTYDQLNSIAMALKLARTNLLKDNKRKLSVGDNVKFSNGSSVIEGKIQDMKVKNSFVTTSSGIVYRVPTLMLEAA